MWSPKVPQFLLDILTALGGFFTFDLPGLMSSPDCLEGTSGGSFAPLDKWYIALLLPFAVILIIAVPVCYYRRTKRDGNKDDERKAEAWTNVFTQISFVWMFATIVTTCLKIVDCDQGTEGRLLIDPLLSCPLAATTSYTVVQSGFCEDVSGRHAIGSQADCEAASVSFGYDKDSTNELQDEWQGATEVSSLELPPGCTDGVEHLRTQVTLASPDGATGYPRFNTDTNSTMACGTEAMAKDKNMYVGVSVDQPIHGLPQLYHIRNCLCVTDTEPAPDAGPAVLGIALLVIYCFGILLFLGGAILLSLVSVKKRVIKYRRVKGLAQRASERDERKKKRQQHLSKGDRLEDVQHKKEKEEDLREEAQDQQEIERIEHQSEETNDENETWKLVGWLMEDYKYPVFELWNGTSGVGGVVWLCGGGCCCCHLVFFPRPFFCCCCFVIFSLLHYSCIKFSRFIFPFISTQSLQS